MKKVLILVILLLATGLITAQEPEGQRVELAAEDGLTLVGDFYAVPDVEGDLPAVLLLHMLNSRRSAWTPLIPQLLDAGYHVLAVDLRGHAETGGSRDWALAQTDTQLWLNWLREQPNVADTQVSLIGASIGTLLALNGCAIDELCQTAIALSPVEFASISDDEIIINGMEDKSMLLIAGKRDGNSADVAQHLMEIAPGRVAVHIYPVGTHGTDMLQAMNRSTSTSVPTLILNWLDDHQPRE